MFGSADARSPSPKNLETSAISCQHHSQGMTLPCNSSHLTSIALSDVAVEETCIENSSKIIQTSYFHDVIDKQSPSIPKTHIGNGESGNYGVMC